MAIIGELRSTDPASLKRLTGYLDHPEGRIVISVEGDPTLLDTRKPSHTIFQRSASGHPIEIGKAWLKTAKTGPNPNSRFFSMTIESPYMNLRLNVAAFANDSGSFDIVWRRQKTTAAA